MLTLMILLDLYVKNLPIIALQKNKTMLLKFHVLVY